MDSEKLKKLAGKNGARLCGIASIDRFKDAPKGFSPIDLFPKTKSVISFAKQVPKGTLNLTNTIPYSVIEEIALHETHRIALELALFIESFGYNAVIVPSEPYDYWDEENKTGKGLVSLKHIAFKCGLGSWGKNHLIYNAQIGNLMKIGAVLTDAILESDKILYNQICKEDCDLCISSCPTGALNSLGVEQRLCRQFSQGKTLKDEPIYSCNMCRKVCPNVYGFKSTEISSVYLSN